MPTNGRKPFILARSEILQKLYKRVQRCWLGKLIRKLSRAREIFTSTDDLISVEIQDASGNPIDILMVSLSYFDQIEKEMEPIEEDDIQDTQVPQTILHRY